MKGASQEQLMLSIGALLAAEREKRGIPVERAAKETRMRPQRIRDIEADDLSHFTNPSYARMFIIAYAKYLGIPMQTIRDHLPDRGESSSEGYQYISTATEELPSLRPDLASRPASRGKLLPILVGVTVLVLLAGAAVLGTYLYVNVPRLTAAAEKPAPTPEPTPLPPEPPIVMKEVVLSNLQPVAETPAAFDGEVQMAAPPTPVPPTIAVGNPAPAQSATSAPPRVMTSEDDREFLLGSSLDPAPTPTR